MEDGVEVDETSPIYESTAQTLGDKQPDYLNAVVRVRTTCRAHELLKACLAIEKAQGRSRDDSSWKPRTLDIDILLFGTEEIVRPGLTIPHPRMADRRFVLQPLSDLEPNLHIARWGTTVSQLLAECRDDNTVARVTQTLGLSDPSANQTELWPSKQASVRTRADQLPGALRYVVIEGVIGAGKTSMARLLAGHFDGQLVVEEFDENPFLARFYEDRPRWAFQTQLAFLASRFRQQQALGNPDLFHQVVISDYMFEKDRLFARLNLEGDELQLYDTMFNIMQASVPQPDLIVYLQASTERLMRLISRRGRTYEQGMDREYIESLNQSYEQFFFRYNKTPLLIVNTEEIDFVNSQDDFDQIIQQISRMGYAGTTYFNPVRT